MRKLLLLAVAIVVVGLAAFWFLTIPQTVSAKALGAHTPNLDNGRTMFFAGGCSSCHAVPKQEDATKLGGGWTSVKAIAVTSAPLQTGKFSLICQATAFPTGSLAVKNPRFPPGPV